MNCEHFVSNYTTGSMVARVRARLHATQCAKCAATRDWLGQLENELGWPAELTDRHRRLWEQAADVDEPQLARAWFGDRRLVLASSLAVAAALVVTVILSIPGTDNSEMARPANGLQGNSSVATTSLKMPADQIVELETGLEEVASEIDRLAEEADRLEARRALGDLATSYPPLGAPDST
jgi:hypothetical protein